MLAASRRADRRELEDDALARRERRGERPPSAQATRGGDALLGRSELDRTSRLPERDRLVVRVPHDQRPAHRRGLALRGGGLGNEAGGDAGRVRLPRAALVGPVVGLEPALDVAPALGGVHARVALDEREPARLVGGEQEHDEPAVDVEELIAGALGAGDDRDGLAGRGARAAEHVVDDGRGDTRLDLLDLDVGDDVRGRQRDRDRAQARLRRRAAIGPRPADRGGDHRSAQQRDTPHAAQPTGTGRRFQAKHVPPRSAQRAVDCARFEVPMRRSAFVLALVAAGAIVACGGGRGGGGGGEPARAGIVISVALPGAVAEHVERSVVEPIEHAVRGVEGIAAIEARVEGERARVALELAAGRDPTVAVMEVQRALEAATRQLPPDAEPPAITKVRLDDAPAAWLAVEGELARAQLWDVADDAAHALERLPGVGRVEVQGIARPAVHVRADLERMASHGVTVTDVAAAVRGMNVALPAGRVDAGGAAVRIVERPDGLEGLRDLVVRRVGDVVVRVGDVALVEEGVERGFGAAAIRVAVHAQPGASLVEVRERVRAALAQLPRPAVAAVREIAAPSDARATGAVGTIRGLDRAELERLADALVAALAAAGVKDVARDPPPGVPELAVAVDRGRAAELGVTAAELATTLRAAAGGAELGRVTANARERSIVFGLPDAPLPELLARVFVRAPDGALVPASALVSVTTELRAPLLRHDREPAIAIRAPAASVAQVRAHLERHARTWPPGVRLVPAR